MKGSEFIVFSEKKAESLCDLMLICKINKINKQIKPTALLGATNPTKVNDQQSHANKRPCTHSLETRSRWKEVWNETESPEVSRGCTADLNTDLDCALLALWFTEKLV